ncbi:hypothetical protein Lal_00013739 [Lupinus albus]|nr:hypothetical protein Lal_00013739 [Lupinus albus]
MSLLIRKFKKFLKRKGGLQRFQREEANDSTKKGKNLEDCLTCHECEKAYIVWDVPEESNKVHYSESDSTSENSPTYDELYGTYVKFKSSKINVDRK